MLKLTNTLGSPAQRTINDWFALNKKEVIWLALVVGGVLLGAIFVS